MTKGRQKNHNISKNLNGIYKIRNLTLVFKMPKIPCFGRWKVCLPKFRLFKVTRLYIYITGVRKYENKWSWFMGKLLKN